VFGSDTWVQRQLTSDDRSWLEDRPTPSLRDDDDAIAAAQGLLTALGFSVVLNVAVGTFIWWILI
jgi:hypothetical protein